MIIIFLNVLFLFILIIIIEKSLVDFIRDVYYLLLNMFLILCYCFLCNKYLMWMIKLYYDV